MRAAWKRLAWLAALLWLGGLLGVQPGTVKAAFLPDYPLPNPVTPEPYPNSDIYPAMVYLPNENDLQALYRLKIDVGGIRRTGGNNENNGSFAPSIATIYINPAESQALTQAGITPIPIQNEGYRSFLEYGPGSAAPNAWPTFAQYVARMQALQAAHPDIVSLVQIGTSVQGRGLFCMEVTDNPGVDEFEPEFKYSANHHGDETTGVEMTMRLAEYLANSYGSDPSITDMIDKMELWLCPIYNPDGYVMGTRYNANGEDLNRNYPDRFEGPPAFLQPETQAYMDFEQAHRFVMGANYHGGEQVLNYPWDAVQGPPYYAPDDQLFYNLGIGYTWRNPDLWNNPYFLHGITRGWEWYMIYGGMQDWDYYYHGEHHVTLEISYTKSPPFTQMDTFWAHNRDAMLWWMQQAMTGIGGQVLDARNSTPLDATLTLVGRDLPNTIRTDPQVGDYHRVISAGSYSLQADAGGYVSQTADVMVISGTLNTHDFYLCPTDTMVVSGTVTDAVSGLPLQATIEFAGSRQATSSDPASGHYSISICPANYTMSARAQWHYPEQRLVVIDHDQTQDFALQPTPNLSSSNKASSTLQAVPEEVVHYQLHAINSGASSLVMITDTLPSEITWTGELSATQGSAVFEAGRILWQGDIAPSVPVTISYSASLNACLAAGTLLLNIAEFDDGVNGIITGKVSLEVLNAAPSTPSTPTPSDGASSQPITTTLAWAPSSDLNCDAITYDVAFGTAPNPPTVGNGLTTPRYNPGELLNGVTYYWRVIAHDGLYVVAGPIWSFTTETTQKIFLPLAIK